jgi:hypothetical protein
MATWQEFTLQLVQTVVFTPEHAAFASGKAVATILASSQDRFDGEMQVLPLPAEVPPEIPPVQLRSSDGRWGLSMAPARIDSVWRILAGASPPSLLAVVSECALVQERYVREMRVRVGRVALIVHRVCPVENPAQALIERFCNEASRREPFNRSESFEIHNHKVYAPRREGIDYEVNSWVRCKTAKLVADNRPVILVEQDMNTLATELESRRFEPVQLHAFFQMAAVEADEILRKYFPG